MKHVNILLPVFLMCLVCANVSAKETKMAARFRVAAEKGVLCNEGMDHDNYPFYKRAAKQLGMELNAQYVRSDPSVRGETHGMDSEYSGYDGYIKPRDGQIKIFGFDLMAVYFEPQGDHFMALVNADEEKVLRLAAKNAIGYGGERWDPLYIEYNKDAVFSSKEGKWWQNGWWYHKGKHTAYGGFNSNRVIFATTGATFASYSVEVESCEDTKSEWFIGICRQFDRKPLTWVGCAHTTPETVAHWLGVNKGGWSEHYPRVEDYWIQRMTVDEILSRKRKNKAKSGEQ